MQSLPDATNRLSPQARVAREVMDVMPQVTWFLRGTMRHHRGGLSLPQFRTLVRVRRQPTINLSVLAEHLGVSLPSASRMVAGLVDKGLLQRKGRSGDRRQMSLALTARGEAVLGAARRATQQCLESQISPLEARQRKTVMEAMGILKRCFASEWIPPENPQNGEHDSNGNTKNLPGNGKHSLVNGKHGGKEIL